MLTYKVNKLSDHVTQITDASGVSMFLIVGEKEALLVDTGTGIKGLKEVVNDITEKPLKVVLTHGHGDHAGGAAAFDEVYLSPVDKMLAIEHGANMRVDYIKMMLKMFEEMGAPHQDFNPEQDMVPAPTAETNFLELKDGMVFELGGVSAEIIAVPGHTKGCCVVLIPEERSIIFGDACNSNTLVGGEESALISEYQAALKHLQEKETYYDTVYLAHGPVTGPVSCLEDNLELCERILAGTDDHIESMGISGPGFFAAAQKNPFTRVDGKFGNIFYSELTRH